MPKQQSLYTFILTHYNQSEYIFTAIDSILEQEYSDIEIIVIDDCSTVFDREAVERYICERKRSNIKSVKILANEENIGTVRSMNRALKAVTGEFVQTFAADDRLHDKEVAANFMKAFERIGEGAVIIFALAMMMDGKLTPPGEYKFPPDQHKRFEMMNAREQYERIVFGCYWTQGAMCARTELYRKMGYFPELYAYVEDWPFYMYFTRNGVKANMADFTALDHRDGGISLTIWEPTAPHATGYQNDILNAMETEIMPYLSSFPIKSQHTLIERYYGEYQTLLNIGGIRKRWRWFDFWKYSKKIVIWRFLAKWRWNNKMLIEKSLRLIWMAAIVFFVVLGARSLVNADGTVNSHFFNAIIDWSAVIGGAVLIGALAVFIVNSVFWLAYRIYRFKREG
jgi:glycosyltransferase involved in cell wall biosynthesis